MAWCRPSWPIWKWFTSKEVKNMEDLNGQELSECPMDIMESEEISKELDNKQEYVTNLKLSGGSGLDNREGSQAESFVSTRLSEYHTIRTLGDAVNSFGLSDDLCRLDEDLENVRRNKEGIENHKRNMNLFSKKIHRFSRQNHPDRVMNKGGSEADLSRAHWMQTALNKINSTFRVLHKEFLDDLEVDHRYGFYMDLEIAKLGNEEDVEDQITGMLMKISHLSDIRRQAIVGVVQKFLTESRQCVSSYRDSRWQDFEKYREFALYHLSECIEGCESFLKECNLIELACKKEGMIKMEALICRMGSEVSRDSKELKKLKESAERSLAGKFQFFNKSVITSEYLVSPFQDYINVIMMCSIMEGKLTRKRTWSLLHTPEWKKREEIIFVNDSSDPFWRAYEYVNFFLDKTDSKKKIRENFDNTLEEIENFLECKFKVDAYNTGSSRKRIFEDIRKCKKMSKEFDEKVKAMEKDLEEFYVQNQEMKRVLPCENAEAISCKPT